MRGTGHEAMARGPVRGLRESTIEIPVEHGQVIQGTLSLPPTCRGLVIFAHGSGSSRFSPRNQFVARTLQEWSMGTLLMDLLTRDEEAIDEVTGHLRFDVDRLAGRVLTATDWAAAHRATGSLSLGYFGASTGAAAALVAAAQRPSVIGAVVSRGGRPDLAGAALPAVEAPTLLLVGERDFGVVELNQQALEMLGAQEKVLQLIPRATHLFQEPGTLEEVARLAADWFERHL